MNDPSTLHDVMTRAANSVEVNTPPLAVIRTSERRRATRTWGTGVAAATLVVTGIAVGVTALGGPAATDRSDGTSVAVGHTPKTVPVNVPAGAPGPVVATMNAEATLKDTFVNVDDMVSSKRVDTIVRGKVVAVTYESPDGLASTVLQVAVAETYAGNVGKTITVHEDGGYVKASDIIAESHEKDPTVKIDLDPNGFVDNRFEGADHLVIGDDVILFLMKDPNVGREGDFMEVGSVYGRFKLDKSGSHVRGGSDAEMAATLTPAQLKSKVAQLR